MTSNQLSEKLLLAVKMEQPTKALVEELASFSMNQLQNELTTDSLKKAFWINIYNAYFQILRKELKAEKPKIYRDKLFTIAGNKMSLDDVEHGVLRRFKYKYSLGFVTNFFTKRLIKKLAVNKLDYRIHFALNCGAKSCPPIAFYNSDRIEQQLEMASISFLEGETTVKDEQKEIHISRLFQWFLADFGGKLGIRNILKDKINIDQPNYKLVFTEYSWDEALDNYAELSNDISSQM